MTFLTLACGLLLAIASLVGAVDRSKFRRCSDTGFCRQHRDKAEANSIYSLDKSSIVFTSNHIDASVIHSKGDNALHLHIEFYESGTARIRITENFERWQPTEVLQRAGMVPTKAERLSASDPRRPKALKSPSEAVEVFAYSTGSMLAVHGDPLKFELYYDDVLQFTANSESYLHFEQKIATSASNVASELADMSEEDRHGGKEVLSYGEDGLAIYTDGTREEKHSLDDTKATSDAASFKESFGGHSDSRPNGPMSVGIDFVFPSAANVYGIPEHATNLALLSTRAENGGSSHYKEPYRMYNLDVFEYELDEPMALYGHIPMMMGHGVVQPANGGAAQPFTAGVFWFNPSETFIDVFESPAGVGKKTHWVSESGNVDFFIFPGPSPAAVYEQYTSLTGRQQLPPLFSLGYHQCRWNYRDQKDVAAVESMFEELDYPVDVIWLDIEHTDGKRYFTWDKKAFPTPLDMQKSVSAHGRKMVTIVDPHIKRDDKFAVHKEATDLGLYIKNAEGKDFDGWCWPGSSSYLDFTNERVRQWWAERFSLTNYVGSSLDLFTWNDMNEPSVFNGPEVSMNKDAKNIEGIEHREWHNLYGMYMQNATSLGLTIRDPHAPKKHMPRPFVLSRAFWAGSQRFGAMWTGDNMANWESLKIASPMLLSIGLAGFSFAGADVGGFFGEPSAELFTRWYQAGAFTPFFRGHAHLDTKRREPWVYGEPYTTIMRQTAMVRYSLLPYWYTVFYQSYSTGQPVMRAMFSEFPVDVGTFTMDDQWMVGRSLLVKPVTDSGVTETGVYFPEAENGWYDFHTFSPIPMGGLKSGVLTVAAPLDVIPVFVRGGSIVPRKMRLRRSASLMFYDPITLMVAPSATTGTAYGTYYMDDERTLDHQDLGMFAYREFSFSPTDASRAKGPGSMTLRSAPVAGSSWMTGGNDINVGNMMAPNKVERIVIMGQHSVGSPKSVTLLEQYPNGRGVWEDGDEKSVQFFFHKETGTLTIKKPNALVTAEWLLLVEY